MREEYLRLFGNLTIDPCMDIWFKCGCEGKGAAAGRGPSAALSLSSRMLRADGEVVMVGSCGETEGQRACTQGACSDLFESFNSQLLYFCPPPGEGPPG